VTAAETPPAPEPGTRARRYGLALAVSVSAWLLSLLLEPLIDPSDLPLFLGAVMLAAWYGGLGPSLLATGLGVLAGTFLLVPHAMWPPRLFALRVSPALVARLAVFALEAIVISVLTARLRAAQRRAELLVLQEQVARAQTERAASRVRDLQRVTDAALGHLHLDDLLRELLGRIRECLAADTVVILLLSDDGQELHVRAAHGLEEEVRQGIRIPIGRGLAGRIAAERRLIVFEDLQAVEIWSPVLRDMRLRSLLGVPLFVEDRVIGVVHVGTLSPRRFTEDEGSLLRLVADRIAIAIDHARLYAAERGARAAAEAAERRFRLLVDGVRDYATYMLDAHGRVASWNAGAARLKGYTEAEILGQSVERFYTADAVRRGEPAHALERAAAEGRYEAETWRVRKDGSGFAADVVVTAVRDEQGRLGGFSVLTHDLTERRRAAEVRARLLDQLITAQEAEQRRIARELHDETGQSLTSLLVGLRTLEDAPTLAAAHEQAGELRRLTVRTLDEVRRLARGLRPGALDELGLVAALEHHAAEYGQARGITVHLETRGLDGQRLPAPVEAALYRIVQEALTNAAEHGHAKTVSLVLGRHAGGVQVIVADDGCGFDVETTLRQPEAGAHLGLHGMRERAALLGGSVTIESTPGEGTTIYARVPAMERQDG
jgi:PAS domain S-box-containing protein